MYISFLGVFFFLVGFSKMSKKKKKNEMEAMKRERATDSFGYSSTMANGIKVHDSNTHLYPPLKKTTDCLYFFYFISHLQQQPQYIDIKFSIPSNSNIAVSSSSSRHVLFQSPQHQIVYIHIYIFYPMSREVFFLHPLLLWLQFFCSFRM